MKDIKIHNVSILIEYTHSLSKEEIKSGQAEGSLHEVTKEALERLGIKEVADKGLTHMSNPTITLDKDTMKATFTYFISLTFPRGFGKARKK